jgi:hypothetical protein
MRTKQTMNKRTKNLRVNQAIGLGALDSNGQEI